ncbi:MAG: FAD:protein FMN transferase [Lachnospiraceae bacterium]|nr:FAD:protein FMN transferase [Lachnospiraceae bacterium]
MKQFLPALTAFFVFCTSLLCGCHPNASASVNGFYFDTVVTVTLYGKDAARADSLSLGIHEQMQTYENLFSRTKEGSDIWRINHSNGTPVCVNSETALLLDKALSYSRLSKGLVDPSVGALSSLWNFGHNEDQLIPEDAQITDALSHVNYENILLNGNEVTLKDPSMTLDLGFIAKGYIADRLKSYLLEKDVESALINLGGNVLALSQKPGNRPFQVGIKRPFDDSGKPLLVLPVNDYSVVTSGNYERYFIIDDVLYHHILSTQTGYPADSDLSQVTILSKDSVDGDALSTLCFLLGYEKATSLIESLPDTEAIFVLSDGSIHQTY